MKELLSLIIEHIAEILTALAALFTAFGGWKGYKNYKLKKTRTKKPTIELDYEVVRKQLLAFEAEHNITKELIRIEENPYVKRVCLLKNHNHGGDMHATTSKFISMINERVNGIKSIIDDWQYRLAPEGYVGEIISPLLVNHEKLLLTDSIKVDELRSIYRSDEIDQSWLFLVYAEEGDVLFREIYYLSIQFGEDGEKANNHEFKTLIYSVVSNLNSIIKDNFDLLKHIDGVYEEAAHV